MRGKTAREPGAWCKKSMEQGAEERNLGSIGSDINSCCFIHKNLSPLYRVSMMGNWKYLMFSFYRLAINIPDHWACLKFLLCVTFSFRILSLATINRSSLLLMAWLYRTLFNRLHCIYLALAHSSTHQVNISNLTLWWDKKRIYKFGKF